MQRKRSSKKAPAKPRKRELRSEAALDTAVEGRRAALVRATYELIAEGGLEELRTRDVAARVGINIATLHYYFDTKETLVAAVVDHMMELFRNVRPPLPPAATALEELQQMFAVRDYRRRVEPELDRVVLEMMIRGQRDQKVRARLEVLLLGWNGYVESLLARGMRDGTFARHLEPRVTAAILTSFMMGTNLQLGVRPNSFDFGTTCDTLMSWLLPK